MLINNRAERLKRLVLYAIKDINQANGKWWTRLSVNTICISANILHNYANYKINLKWNQKNQHKKK